MFPNESLNKFNLLLPDECVPVKIITCVASCTCLLLTHLMHLRYLYASALLTAEVGGTKTPSCWVEQVVVVFKLGLLRGFVQQTQLRSWDTGEVVSVIAGLFPLITSMF